MKIVLDTNCFISCIGKKSLYRSIFDAFLDNKFTLCVSTEILLEYEEKFQHFWGIEVTHNLLATILTAENTSLYSSYYNFNLVEGDEDDNKFSDTYLTASADILVSNDAKLLALNSKDYPAIIVMNIHDFKSHLKNLNP